MDLIENVRLGNNIFAGTSIGSAIFGKALAWLTSEEEWLRIQRSVISNWITTGKQRQS